MLNTKKQEAYLNEFKGNLFEYLVAHQLAKKYKIELPFLKNIPIEFNNKLKSYEQIVRQYRPELINDLSIYASQLCKMDYWDKVEGIESINLCGKLVKHHLKDQFSEADIILIKNDDQQLPISLKLTHEAAFVNTKSAGLKSFFKTYFSKFENIQLIQDKLNQLVEIEYQNFSRKLHDLKSLQYHPTFKYWIEAGGTQLPGELNETESEILRSYYLKLISFIHSEIIQLNKIDPFKFLNSIVALMGKSEQDLLQVICFYSKNDSTKLTKIKFDKKILNTSTLKIDETICNSTNFSITLEDRILQIRIKPMNTFTQMSFKVNCSVKYLD